MCVHKLDAIVYTYIMNILYLKLFLHMHTGVIKGYNLGLIRGYYLVTVLECSAINIGIF